eukprot:CAMPEP_0181344008 /NCGR_PEP_ID=MMETSP1101-20121128/31928_1 /TAXON_ID=46948 /ORGANISM="Rhodomonas abbreviata, Strain Caron Lab Isolate" /LENGTH=51 /DNA_ID=CAMNT_0023455751 /DNA_START=217 /DNA_END=368 /DNA_ORIENTATION=-
MAKTPHTGPMARKQKAAGHPPASAITGTKRDGDERRRVPGCGLHRHLQARA